MSEQRKLGGRAGAAGLNNTESRKPTLRHFAVISPVYETGGYSEPPETTCDYVVVDAPTKKAAIVAGLREMRKHPSMTWHRDNAPGSPFRGLKAVEVCPHEIPLADAQAGWCEECGGPGPCPAMVNDYDPCTLLGGHEGGHVNAT